MPILRTALLVVAVAIFAGCTSPPTNQGYFPLVGDSDTGYYETPVREDGFEVSYSALGTFNPTKARFFATVRAAEITVSAGHRYFEILQARPGENAQLWSQNPATSSTSVTSGDVNYPGVSSLVIKIASASSNATLDAVAVLRQAQSRGIVLSSESLAAMRSVEGKSSAELKT